MFLKSFDGTKIWYQINRKKESNLFLLFIHGWANNFTAWKEEESFFRKKGYSTINLDLRGHGKSEKPEDKKQYSLDCFTKDIHSIIKKEKIDNFILVGHSMGGMIALDYFKHYSRQNKIKGMVLCNTSYKNPLDDARNRKYSNMIKRILRYINSKDYKNRDEFFVKREIDLNEFRGSSDFSIFFKGLKNASIKSVLSCLEAMGRFNLGGVLHKVNVPVLVIYGSEDKIIPLKYSFRLYLTIKGAQIRFVRKGSHQVNITNPELVEKYILGFLVSHGLKPFIDKKL